MESIKGHPEHVETVFGEAIVARDESLVVLAGACGLGPPDLCWLQKAFKSALTGATGESKGYYHCCLGIDASSSAAVAAYFATLTSLVEPPTFLQGLFSTSEMRVERGFYCCYDPLTRLDVRCELCIPGGVVCGALDCEGNVHDVTPDLWRNCVVATFLRSELYDAELVSHSPVPVARYPPLPSPADESRLLDAVAGLYEDGVLPEALEALTVDQAGGAAPEHADVVLHTLLHYFAKRQRWGQALEFFARLTVHYPTAAMYVAALQRECGLYDDALATLSRAVDEVPDDPLLLAALATECLYSDQVEAALRFATKAARLRPLLRAAWLALARAHVRLGAGTAALVVLNLVPPPPLPGKEEGMLHVVVPPDPKSVTKPAVPAYDLDVISIRQVLAEEALVHPPNSTGAVAAAPGAAGSSIAAGVAAAPSAAGMGGGSGTATLPGALLVPREPPDAATAPDTAPLRITRAVLAAVYTVLQELVAVSGWDGFLRLRSAAFVMHADSDLLREQQREAAEREKQLQLLHRQLSATLPPSPGWAQQAPLQPVAGMRPAPEDVDLHSALDEAVRMGLAEYPEHLEDNYDDPRVIAAREANRRHLREIAERQAKLEAAEGGAYADDEWDGSSSGSGGGGPRSTTSRSRRGKGAKGRKGKRAQSTAATGAGKDAVAAAPQELTAAESTAVAGEGAEEAAAAGGQEVRGVVVATAIIRQTEQQQAEQLEGSAGYGAKTAASGGDAADANGGNEDDKRAPAPAAAAPAAAAGWWGTLFGGAGAQPQRREPGPLGEACEPAMTSNGGGSTLVLGLAALAPWRSPRLLPAAATAGDPATLWQPPPPKASPAGWRSSAAAAVVVSAVVRNEGSDNEGVWWRPAQAPEADTAVAAVEAAKADAQEVVVCPPLSSRCTHRAGGCRAGGCRAGGGDGGSVQSGRAVAAAPQGPARALEFSPYKGSALRSCGSDRGRGGRRCMQVVGAGASCSQASSSSSSPARPGLGSPVALAKGLLGLLVCKLKSQAAGYRWRQRQRRLQRALMLAAATPALMSYGPLSPLLPAADVSCQTRPAGAAVRLITGGRGRVGPTTRGHRRKSGSAAAAGAGADAWSNIPAVMLEAVQVSALPGLVLPRVGLGGGGGSVVRRCGLGPVAEAVSGDEAAADPAAFADGAAATAVVARSAMAVAVGAPGSGGEVAAADEGFPLVLQNQDADRQMVLDGVDATELGAKRLCARWLDELIVALWHDLQAFLDWKALDTDLHDAGFHSHAEIVAGIAPGPSPADYQRAATAAGGEATGPALPPPPPPVPVLPALEWLRRGLLAERLHHEADALAAYQAAFMTPPPPPAGAGSAGSLLAALPGGGPGAFSMIGLQAIMRLAPVAEPRDSAWALRAAQAVMMWLEARAPAGSGTTVVPFTSGILLPAHGTGSSSAAAATGTTNPAAAGIRAAPAAATAAAAIGGGKLQACPLPVVHCLHLVAAVLGDVGVEAALAARMPAATAPAAKGGGGVSVHPAAATVLRQAVRMNVAAQSAAGGGGAGVGSGGGAGGVAAAAPTAQLQAAGSQPPGRTEGADRG